MKNPENDLPGKITERTADKRLDEQKDLKTRTKEFALRIIRLYSAMPNTTASQVLGKQILRSGTSVGAQYREGVRAKSDADFINKLEGSLQELEETSYWRVSEVLCKWRYDIGSGTRSS